MTLGTNGHPAQGPGRLPYRCLGPAPFSRVFPSEQVAGCCTRGHRSCGLWFHRSTHPNVYHITRETEGIRTPRFERHGQKTATEREDTVRDAYEAAPYKHPNLEQTRRPLHQVMPTNRSPVLAASRAFPFVTSLICARMLRTDIIVIEGRAAQDGKSTNDRKRP